MQCSVIQSTTTLEPIVRPLLLLGVFLTETMRRVPEGGRRTDSESGRRGG